MPRWLVIVLAVAVLAAAAVVERMTSGQQSGDARAAAAKLAAVPASFGDWTSNELVMDEKVLRVAEATGHVSRLYTNRKTGAQMSVLLLCGPTGPIGAHTPEVCYTGSGYALFGEPQKRTVALPGGASATYWSARFEKKPGVTDPPLRVCWTWGADGDWQASANPRTDFALRGALYKLYVQRAEPAGTAAGPAPDPTDEFFTAFLPEVKKALAVPPAAPK
jgi:hypothetical protein